MTDETAGKTAGRLTARPARSTNRPTKQDLAGVAQLVERQLPNVTHDLDGPTDTGVSREEARDLCTDAHPVTPGAAAETAGQTAGPFGQRSPSPPDRRDDPQWERRAERWVRVVRERYPGRPLPGAPEPEGYAVVISGADERGEPDGERFLAPYRTTTRADADLVAGSLVSILADIIEAETRAEAREE